MADYVSPISVFSIQFQDHSKEYSNVSIFLEDVTALNMAALNVELQALLATIENIILCEPASSGLSVLTTLYDDGVPVSPWAQREIALQVGYHDTTTMKKYHITLPGINWEAIGGQGDEVDYADLGWVAFATAFNLTARSPAGNAVLVDYGRLVGRR
jgi:endoglucanase Acf2